MIPAEEEQIDVFETSAQTLLTSLHYEHANHVDIDTTIDSIDPDMDVSIFSGLPCIRANGGKTHRVTGTAVQQLLQKVSVPGPYLRRCPLDLQLQNLFHWIEVHKDKKIKVRLAHDTIRAILSQRFSTECDDVYLIPKIFETIRQLAEDNPDYQPGEVLCSSAEDISIVRIPYPEISTEIAGLQTQAGIIITNSEVGRASASVAPVLFRSNRYYIDDAPDGVTSIRHIGEANPERVAIGVEKALKAAQVGIEALVHAWNVHIHNITTELEIVQKKYDAIPSSCVSAVCEALSDVPSITQLELADHLLLALQELPLFQKLLAEKQVGNYLGLFRDIDTRLQMMLED